MRLRWPPERTAELTRLRKLNWPFKEIAAQLGVTENAAIGKWDRVHRPRWVPIGRKPGRQSHMWTEESLTKKWGKG